MNIIFNSVICRVKYTFCISLKIVVIFTSFPKHGESLHASSDKLEIRLLVDKISDPKNS